MRGQRRGAAASHPGYGDQASGHQKTLGRCAEEKRCAAHYEGIDERVIEELQPEEISIGDYVLTGGELPALIVADSISRMLPGVLSDDECFEDESHFNSLLEYPQYTHPAEWNGREVPEVLLSGHHQNVDAWRRQQSIKRTFERRPDMLENAELSKKDKLYLSELKANEKHS